MPRRSLTLEIEFRHYEVPTLNFDDLVGFLNPKSLAKGSLTLSQPRFRSGRPRPLLFDEINRANPFLQSKLHEFIRTRKVMGLPTKLKVVFSAVNPPETYQSGYMDLAIASRFVSVQVPNIGEMKGTDLDRILGKGQKVKPSSLKQVLKKAAGVSYARKDLQKVEGLARHVVQDLAETFGFHDIRHTVAKYLNDLQKVGLKKVQQVLRHNRQTTTEIYVEGNYTDTKDAMKLLELKNVEDFK